MPSYRRFLSQDFCDLLKPGGCLNFLLSLPPEADRADPFSIDVQLRAGNIIQYYHGTASLLRVRYSGDGSIRGDAAAVYHDLPGASDLMQPCRVEPDELRRFQHALDDYLPHAIAATVPRSYRNRQEGFWQNCLAITFGRNWQPGMDWLIVDREVVIEFDSDAERQQTLAPHRERYLTARRQLRAENPDLWGQPTEGDSLGNELDLLALGPSGELICIELKHGSNASGIYWGPLQACAYRDDFELVLPSIADGIKALVNQKIELGLLPPSGAKRIPAGDCPKVLGLLAVADPNDRSTCWDRLNDLFTRFAFADIPVVGIRSWEDPGLAVVQRSPCG
jgi:hypothetical protein